MNKLPFSGKNLLQKGISETSDIKIGVSGWNERKHENEELQKKKI